MARIFMRDLAEVQKRLEDNNNLPGTYVNIVIPGIAPTAELVQDLARVGIGAVANPYNRALTLITIDPFPVMKKYQVSYKAGNRWGSRVVMAVSQEAANKAVAEEIAASIGARPVRG